jgi:hypothetical protein
MGSIELELRVNQSMIICHITKLIMNLLELSHLDLGSMLPGHRIKCYGLIECDKLYPMLMTNLPWSFFMLISPSGKSVINYISVQWCFGIIFSHS